MTAFQVGTIIGLLIWIGLLLFLRFLIVLILVYIENLLMMFFENTKLEEPIRKVFRILDNIIARGKFSDPKP